MKRSTTLGRVSASSFPRGARCLPFLILLKRSLVISRLSSWHLWEADLVSRQGDSYRPILVISLFTLSRFNLVRVDDGAPALKLVAYWKEGVCARTGENGATLTPGTRVCEKTSLWRLMLSLVRSITLNGDRCSPNF